MGKTVSKKSRQEQNIFLCALRGVLAAALCAIALAVLTSVIGLSMAEPDKYTKIFAFVCLFCAAFAGGFVCARAKGSATLLCGALTGLFLLALIAVITLCFSLSMNVPLFGICVPCVLLLCVLGANLGIGSR